MVKVTNRGTKPFRDMYDGVVLELTPGEGKVVPEVMARHIFGYGEDDKKRALTRLGWLKVDDRKDGVPGGWMEAMARLGHFVFTPQVMVDADGGDAPDLSNQRKKAVA